jgi:predicted O-methyltransferase YrrM
MSEKITPAYALKTFFWFVRRPGLLPEFVRLMQRNLGPKSARNAAAARAQAEAWCAERAVDTAVALQQLTGKAAGETLEARFAQVMQAARQRAEAAPTTMGGAANLDLLYTIAASRKARRLLETGVAYGWSSLALLLAISDEPSGKLISVDMPIPNRGNDQFVGVAVPDTLRTKWELIRLADREGLPKALKKMPQIDLASYDSDKSYEGRMWAYPRIWEHLVDGGVLVSDDIGDNMAFAEFAEQVKRTPIIVFQRERYNGILVK